MTATRGTRQDYRQSKTQTKTKGNTMLEEFNDDYQKTEAAKSNGGELPDGDYVMEVTQSEITMTKKDPPRPMWVLSMRVTDPETMAGRYEWRNTVIDANRLQYIKRDIETCGLDLEQFSDFERRAGEIEGALLKVTIKHNKDYRNVYINDLVGRVEPAAVADDDEAPF